MVPIVQAGPRGGLNLLFTSRDADGRSHVGRAQLDLDAGVARDFEPAPLLAPGPLGAFDDSGAMASCVVRDGGRELLYYIGWTRGVTVPFYTFVGCAVSEDGARYERVSPAPILPRSEVDPYLTTAPWVLIEDGTWRMWYASGSGWEATGDRPLHRYNIRYAESSDGVRWRRDGTVCIDYADGGEYALTRPCVIRDRDTYRMWYSRRGQAYRIGYAESRDGVEWTRLDDEAGIDVSSDGFDTDMIEYPFVADARGRRYMLYNGNGYGETGIGWAELQR
jgi:hypothetical protein